jgi:hypothetical protein
MTSVMYGIFRSSCRVWLEKYHGAFVIILSLFDLLAQTHSSIPYVQIGWIHYLL